MGGLGGGESVRSFDLTVSGWSLCGGESVRSFDLIVSGRGGLGGEKVLGHLT